MADVALRARNYPELVERLDARRRELGLTMEELDHRSGVQSGYSAKIICGDRGLGRMSLESLIGALECDLVVVPRRPIKEPAPAVPARHYADRQPNSGETP